MTLGQQAGTAPPGSNPGLRTLASPKFRLLLAGCLALLALAVAVLFTTSMWALEMPFLSDFEAYLDASERWLQGEPVYFQEQLQGPVDAWCLGCYLYPPPLAQALAPVTVLPDAAAKVLWYGLATTAAIASTWLATGIAGAARSLESFLWSTAATLLFFPVLLANSAGNVGSFVALAGTMVAMGGVAAGAGAAFGVLLKVVPGAYVPAVLVAPGRAWRSLLASLVVAGGLSFILAPTSWLEYPSAFLNMTAGSTDYERNMALANVAAQLDLPSGVAAASRFASLGIAGAALIASVWLARRPAGMPAAALAASVAMLLLPGTLWPHYLVVLLPFAAMAWPRAGAVMRLTILGAASALSVASLVASYLGAWSAGAVLVVAVGWVLVARRSA